MPGTGVTVSSPSSGSYDLGRWQGRWQCPCQAPNALPLLRSNQLYS